MMFEQPELCLAAAVMEASADVLGEHFVIDHAQRHYRSQGDFAKDGYVRYAARAETDLLQVDLGLCLQQSEGAKDFSPESTMFTTLLMFRDKGSTVGVGFAIWKDMETLEVNFTEDTPHSLKGHLLATAREILVRLEDGLTDEYVGFFNKPIEQLATMIQNNPD